MGIQKPLAINHVASIAPRGAGVPELLTADPAAPRVRQRAKIHMSRKQKQAWYSPPLKPTSGFPWVPAGSPWLPGINPSPCANLGSGPTLSHRQLIWESWPNGWDTSKWNFSEAEPEKWFLSQLTGSLGGNPSLRSLSFSSCVFLSGLVRQLWDWRDKAYVNKPSLTELGWKKPWHCANPRPAGGPMPVLHHLTQGHISTCPHGGRFLSSGGNSYHLVSTYSAPSTIPSALSVYLN